MDGVGGQDGRSRRPLACSVWGEWLPVDGGKTNKRVSGLSWLLIASSINSVERVGVRCVTRSVVNHFFL